MGKYSLPQRTPPPGQAGLLPFFSKVLWSIALAILFAAGICSLTSKTPAGCGASTVADESLRSSQLDFVPCNTSPALTGRTSRAAVHMWLPRQARHGAAQRTLCYALIARACDSPVAGSSRTSGSYALLGGLTILYEGLRPSGGVGARRATYGFFLLRAASSPPWIIPSLGCSPACRAAQQQGAACRPTPRPTPHLPPAPHPQPPASGPSLVLHPSALAALFMCAAAHPPQCTPVLTGFLITSYY